MQLGQPEPGSANQSLTLVVDSDVRRNQ